eukprot:4246888-Alexandrium_andersonii.AAC.1
MSPHASSKLTVSPMSDIAEGGTRGLSASSGTGRAPDISNSARPDCSPCSPWAGAGRPPDDEAASGR